jgi:uncharacterized protein YecE (DUF72 family)
MTYHLGTSGWSYPGWRERFYPAGLSSKEWLEFYASTLSPDYRNVIEFRHESWYEDKVFDLLRSRNIIFCIVSSQKVPRLFVETAHTAYVRFHGLTGEHRYEYSDRELEEWASEIKKLGSKDCYVYFNNDYKAYAVANCRRLAALLEDES